VPATAPLLAATAPLLAATAPLLAATAPLLAATAPLLAATAPLLAAMAPLLAVTTTLLAATAPLLLATTTLLAATPPLLLTATALDGFTLDGTALLAGTELLPDNEFENVALLHWNLSSLLLPESATNKNTPGKSDKYDIPMGTLNFESVAAVPPPQFPKLGCPIT